MGTINSSSLLAALQQAENRIHKTTIGSSGATITSSASLINISGDFSCTDDLTFTSKTNFAKGIEINGGIFKNITFLGGSYSKLIFKKGQFNGYVSIRGGHFKNIQIFGGSFNHWLGTLDGISNKIENINLAEDKLTIDRFEIEGGSFANNIWISGGYISRLELKCVTPIKIHIHPNDDEILINELQYGSRYNSTPNISELIFSRYSHKENFYQINSLNLTSIRFRNFTNIGTITISHISVKNEIEFFNSDLGKTSFIDCDFSNNKLIFNSSKINEIGIAGTILPPADQIESHGSFKNAQKRLALGQLKRVYNNMGDFVQANNYHSAELESHRVLLINKWDKLNLWMNSKSNYHGQNWIKPLLYMLLINSIFFSVYCWSLGFQVCNSRECIIRFAKTSMYIIEFINPLRKIDFLPKALLNIKNEYYIPSIAIIVDGCSRLINAYLIYQFVAAFRKFGRRND